MSERKAAIECVQTVFFVINSKNTAVVSIADLSSAIHVSLPFCLLCVFKCIFAVVCSFFVVHFVVVLYRYDFCARFSLRPPSPVQPLQCSTRLKKKYSSVSAELFRI